MSETNTQHAADLMRTFAEQTGLTPAVRPPRRYLWTDAYAVCNYLELYRQTGQLQYQQLALELIEHVHWGLGRFRESDSRIGWISGLSEAAGAMHPTAGGLRIGKKLAERRPEEAFDARLEWDRDGQYFHYLTKWAHALAMAAEATQDENYARWAIELADAAHDAFVYAAAPHGLKQMYWKMSTDLSYPLVPSMGHHDPLDGLVTAWTLRACAETMLAGYDFATLDRQALDFAEMSVARNWDTDDALGLGGLLFDAARIVRLIGLGHPIDPALLVAVLAAAIRGLTALLSTNALDYPAGNRLAFRELGLAIGLHSISIATTSTSFDMLSPRQVSEIEYLLNRAVEFCPVAEKIEDFWLSDHNQAAASWREHRDINMVMLASGLLPNSMQRAKAATEPRASTGGAK